MKRRLIQLGVLIVVLAIGGAIVVASGIVPVKASSGHWPITHWVLDFASEQQVSRFSQQLNSSPAAR